MTKYSQYVHIRSQKLHIQPLSLYITLIILFIHFLVLIQGFQHIGRIRCPKKTLSLSLPLPLPLLQVNQFSKLLYRKNRQHLFMSSTLEHTIIEKTPHIIEDSNTNIHHTIPWPLIKTHPVKRMKSVLSIISKPYHYIKNKYQTSLQQLDNEVPMLKYLWPRDNLKLKLYLIVSIVCLFFGNWLKLQVPFAFQRAIDTLSITTSTGTNTMASSGAIQSILTKLGVSPIGLVTSLAIVSYGFARGLATALAELKTCLFTHVSQNVCRKFALEIFERMHSLGSEFHVRNPSGSLSVGYVRAVRGFQSLLFEIVFSVAPMFIELGLGSIILAKKFGSKFAGLVMAIFTIYIIYTIAVTQWKIGIREKVVEVDGKRNSYFIDSILNHEVVKLFNRAPDESKRYDSFLAEAERLYISTTYAVAVLNLGQAVIFGAGLVAILLMAASGVSAGTMTVGELVAVNAIMMQLSMPFNWMGMTYQEIREAIVDMGYIKTVMNTGTATSDKLANSSLTSILEAGMDFDRIAPRKGPSRVEFKDVTFRYNSTTSGGAVQEQLLANLSFVVEPGENVAIVGPSGSGKSTVLKLMTRLLETNNGTVLIDSVDTKTVSLASLRNRIAVIPQDTSLFDNTLEYNIKFGNQNATLEEVEDVINRCKLTDAVRKLPQGLQTPVGERGARLSGGERQKVAIARALLRKPGIILCDEITSSVDAFAEKDIVNTIRDACGLDDSKCAITVITVAHRLSSIMHCDKVIVMDKGVLLEQGSHQDLLIRPDSVYGSMWRSQRGEETVPTISSKINDSKLSDINLSYNSRHYNKTKDHTSTKTNNNQDKIITNGIVGGLEGVSMYDELQGIPSINDENDYYFTGWSDA